MVRLRYDLSNVKRLSEAEARARKVGYPDYNALLTAHERTYECPPGSNRCSFCKASMAKTDDSPSMAVARILSGEGER